MSFAKDRKAKFQPSGVLISLSLTKKYTKPRNLENQVIPGLGWWGTHETPSLIFERRWDIPDCLKLITLISYLLIEYLFTNIYLKFCMCHLQTLFTPALKNIVTDLHFLDLGKRHTPCLDFTLPWANNCITPSLTSGIPPLRACVSPSLSFISRPDLPMTYEVTWPAEERQHMTGCPRHAA